MVSRMAKDLRFEVKQDPVVGVPQLHVGLYRFGGQRIGESFIDSCAIRLIFDALGEWGVHIRLGQQSRRQGYAERSSMAIFFESTLSFLVFVHGWFACTGGGRGGRECDAGRRSLRSSTCGISLPSEHALAADHEV